MTTETNQPPDVAAEVSIGTPAIPVPPEVIPPVAEAPKPVPPPAYLTKEEAQQLIADAVKQGKETGRREMQSEKDKDVRDAIRRASLAERELANLGAGYEDLDPEVKDKVELAQHRARQHTQQQINAEDAQRRMVEDGLKQFNNSLTEYATEVGLDPSDKRLNWGDETETLLTRQNKFLKSVASIQKEDRKKTEETQSRKLSDELMKMRKELGLESPDNIPPSVPKSNTVSQATADYVTGNITYEEAVKRGVKFT